MAYECELCGKKTSFGRTYTKRGLAKAKGGNGRKITGKTNRAFKPNIQRIRVVVNGAVKRQKVCTACMRAGKVTKPSKMSLVLDDAGVGTAKKRNAPATPAAS